MSKDSIGILYDLFADLLMYPTSSITQKTEERVSQLRTSHPDIASALEKFLHDLGGYPLEKIQELYTTTFDMQPVCYPYLGHQLFGESYKRGAFMAQLNEAYHAIGYSSVQELPDHIVIVLRFIGLDSANRQSDFCQTLINDGVMPALEKMLKVFGTESENPYHELLLALRLFLVDTPEKELDHA